MKKLIMACALVTAVTVVSACHSSRTMTVGAPAPEPVLTGNQTGGADPQSAVAGFLGAVKKQDLQAISAYWGSEDGLARDMYPREEVEKRELIMACYLKHDRYEIVADAPGIGGGRTLAVNMALGDKARSTSFTLVEGKNRRWYVKDVDLARLQDFCATRR